VPLLVSIGGDGAVIAERRISQDVLAVVILVLRADLLAREPGKRTVIVEPPPSALALLA
jgi:hypothetical protein